MIEPDICDVCGSLSDETLGKVIPQRQLCLDCHTDEITEVLDSMNTDNKLIGTISGGSKPDECIIYFEGKPCSWEAFGRYVSTHEGWNIKIEFGSTGEE